MTTIGENSAKVNRMVDSLWKAQFWSEFQAIAVRVEKWYKAKPDNEDLKIMSKAVQEMTYYINALEKKQDILEQTILDEQKAKLRALERARRNEKKRYELQEQLKNLKI